jgi:hypothetical protein
MFLPFNYEFHESMDLLIVLVLPTQCQVESWPTVGVLPVFIEWLNIDNKEDGDDDDEDTSSGNNYWLSPFILAYSTA